ncbi:hypothetical protein T11_3447 [Trichinella zimbabwensis]|uniref:Uncharacterized protein n=1 Tax=Trichinella zimbabwensis TaxID=268475 RepID=A0A0V1I4C3_9BILA|nr:hypothetical protein T11_3447 [Trichinella zimbabwensis]
MFLKNIEQSVGFPEISPCQQGYYILPGRESNPGRPRDRREYSPLYYRGRRYKILNYYNSKNGNTYDKKSWGKNSNDMQFKKSQIFPKYTAIDFTNYEILNAAVNSIMNQVMNKMMFFEFNKIAMEMIFVASKIACYYFEQALLLIVDSCRNEKGKENQFFNKTDRSIEKPNHTCRCYNLLVHCNNYNVLDVWQGLNVDLKLTF